ncbi:lipopolysaccharide biosynthesis protein [Pedobacter metabolipauper]|uniref:Mrp family chromosome partitioning ATPase n=1 Tax=Pedobacter metabolipauper TaxID=425513 RepID=A0A4R6T3R5_9SPHI|nr:lipopolysaccharide biosynthesis protein [Pedobacter metabolipauper]TDQ12011.1 Mrp family chromosome partitioning ATPase [Pedobacter metabolipauper]
MTEVFKFLKFLKQFRLLLIIVPIISVIITYFLVRNLKSVYMSQAQISTGIVDETSQQSVIIQTIQGDQVRQQFSNLLEMIKMKRVLNQVSYLLIIHDLTSDKPFKAKSKLLESLVPEARKHALDVYRKKYALNEELSVSNPDENGLYKVIESMGYHADEIRGKLLTFRSGDSDFITVQIEAESPDLSAFLVNTISTEFIKSYGVLLKANQVKANNFLRDLLREKTDTLALKMADLRSYKIRNGVLNLSEQSKQLYTLILEYDTKKQEAIEKTSSYAGALNEIDRKFNPQERSYIEAKLSKLNQSIINTKEELSSLYTLYLNNDLDEGYKKSYDSLSSRLTEQINRSSDEYVTNPFNTKQELISQKLNLEIQMDISRYSINSLENKIRSLTSQFTLLVPKEAEVQTLEMNVDIASKEYLDILNKYNLSSLETGFESKMNLVQLGVGGLAQPSKKVLLVILSAVISFSFCVLALFIIFLSDTSIATTRELYKATDGPILGVVSKLENQSVDLRGLWKSELEDAELIEFRNQLRSLRYEIESVMKDKVLLVTSVNSQVGKTFVSFSLAYAWKMTNLKVLLIDGNFKNPHISNSSTSTAYLEDFLQDKIHINDYVEPGTIDVLKNRGEDISLMELVGYDKIKSKLDWAKSRYDFVIIETGALSEVMQSKEWLSFSSDTVTVFKSGKTISEKDNNYISLLKNSGSFRGWILNMVTKANNQQEFFKL